jgi:hypothetical protein
VGLPLHLTEGTLVGGNIVADKVSWDWTAPRSWDLPGCQAVLADVCAGSAVVHNNHMHVRLQVSMCHHAPCLPRCSWCLLW